MCRNESYTYDPHSFSAVWNEAYSEYENVRGFESDAFRVPSMHGVHNSFCGYPKTPWGGTVPYVGSMVLQY